MFFRIGTCIIFSLIMCAGGKPSQGTPADQRLTENKPGAMPPAMPKKPKKPMKPDMKPGAMPKKP